MRLPLLPDMKIFRPDKQTLKSCKIYRMLRKHADARHISFHTPGHKAGAWDITELSFSDNLSCPRGVLAEAEGEIAEILGAAKSFILTDGSTSGILSMLKAGGVKKIAVPRLSHKSVFNGCRLLGIEPVLMDNPSQADIPLPPTVYEMSEKLARADALFLTSPDYYGNFADLKSARALCKRQNKPLFVDGAHGGHLHFERESYAGSYADMWVDGVHKSLPALTQGAVVSAKTDVFAAKLRDAVDIFRTTSPSYPIMASVEYAVKFPRNVELERKVSEFVHAYPQMLYSGGDWTKLCVRLSGHGEAFAFETEKKFEKQGVYPEFCDGRFIMFYLSPATTNRDFKILKKALVSLFRGLGRTDARRMADTPGTEFAPTANKEQVSAGKGTVWLPLSEAEGKICARTFGLFPPCTPLVSAGSPVTREAIERVLRADNVFGLSDKNVCVFTDESKGFAEGNDGAAG